MLSLGLNLQAQASSKAIERKIGRGLVYAGLMTIAAVLLTGAIALCFAALWLYVKPIIGAVYACLLVAGVLCVLALVISIMARSRARSKRRVLAIQPALLMSTLDIEKSIRKQKPLFLIAALMAGALAASGK